MDFAGVGREGGRVAVAVGWRGKAGEEGLVACVRGAGVAVELDDVAGVADDVAAVPEAGFDQGEEPMGDVGPVGVCVYT